MQSHHLISIFSLFAILSINPLAATGTTYALPPQGIDIVGDTTQVKAQYEDTLLDIARRHDLGQDEILLANPKVDRWLPGEGTEVVLPTRFIFPDAEREGLILNLPEMRLYYFYTDGREKKPMVKSYPVGVGRMEWRTPLGKGRVAIKDKDPIWRPPKSLKLEAKAEGDPLPDVVRPGPDNPLGRYALRLTIPGYLIHGTNKPFGVGMRVSHGCIRMYPEDIAELFSIVPINTKINIINQPVKIGWLEGTLYLEVHPFFNEDRDEFKYLKAIAYKMIFAEVENKNLKLNLENIKRAIRQKSGVPVPVTLPQSVGANS